MKATDTNAIHNIHQPHTLIEPESRISLRDLREVWAYRELLWVLMTRDIKVRYKQTVLGVLWVVLQPVMFMLVLSLVFGRLAKIPSDGFPYPVFVYAGLLPWLFVSNTVSNASNSLVGAAHLVSKVYFPRILIPISTIGSGLVDLLVSTIVLLGIMQYFSIDAGLSLLWIPLLILTATLLAVSLGILISALNVSYRDFRYIVPFSLQLWMYATPIVYPLSIVPEQWRWVMLLNPLTGVIEAFRSAFLQRPIDLAALALSLFASLLMVVLAAMFFQRVERRFADVI